MLLVEVHQLHLVVGDLLLVGRLEHEGDGVGLVLRLDRDNVVGVGALQDLAHAAEVHAHGELAVATELVEPVGPQGDVAVVHGLEICNKKAIRSAK